MSVARAASSARAGSQELLSQAKASAELLAARLPSSFQEPAAAMRVERKRQASAAAGTSLRKRKAEQQQARRASQRGTKGQEEARCRCCLSRRCSASRCTAMKSRTPLFQPRAATQAERRDRGRKTELPVLESRAPQLSHPPCLSSREVVSPRESSQLPSLPLLPPPPHPQPTALTLLSLPASAPTTLLSPHLCLRAPPPPSRRA
jgi:hypothetical protein